MEFIVKRMIRYDVEIISARFAVLLLFESSFNISFMKGLLEDEATWAVGT